MKLQQVMRICIGTMVLASALLSAFHSLYWLYFTGFIGLNLIQFGFTGFCPLEKILLKMGLKK